MVSNLILLFFLQITMDDNLVYDDLEQNQECQDSKSLEDFTKPEKTTMPHVPLDPVPNCILELFLMHSLSSKALMGFGVSWGKKEIYNA